MLKKNQFPSHFKMYTSQAPQIYHVISYHYQDCTVIPLTTYRLKMLHYNYIKCGTSGRMLNTYPKWYIYISVENNKELFPPTWRGVRDPQRVWFRYLQVNPIYKKGVLYKVIVWVIGSVLFHKLIDQRVTVDGAVRLGRISQYLLPYELFLTASQIPDPNIWS
jgi:hypothetical protein